jgi:RNA polymerase sigma-70 factor (ECF subfamily)
LENDRLHIDLQKEREWLSASRKDIAAFKPLYEKYFDEIFRFILRRTDDESLTADLTSQTFYKALSNLKKFEWRDRPFVTWLYTIAGNEIRKHFRDRKITYTLESDSFLAEEELENDWPAQQQLKLQAAMATLSDEEIRIIELKYLEGYTFQEMALIFEKSESAIKMRLYRTVESIKEKVSEHHGKK